MAQVRVTMPALDITVADGATIQLPPLTVRAVGPGPSPPPPPPLPPADTIPEGTTLVKPATLVVVDLAAIPGQIRAKGLGQQHRDSIHWYALSRSYAGWDWSNEANKLGCQDMWAANAGIRDALAARLAQSMAWLRGNGSRAALLVINDAKDRHGRFLVDEMLKHIPGDVAARVSPGGPFLPKE